MGKFKEISPEVYLQLNNSFLLSIVTAQSECREQGGQTGQLSKSGVSPVDGRLSPERLMGWHLIWGLEPGTILLELFKFLSVGPEWVRLIISLEYENWQDRLTDCWSLFLQYVWKYFFIFISVGMILSNPAHSMIWNKRQFKLSRSPSIILDVTKRTKLFSL